MAITKNALLRYQVLDRCFRNPGKEYTLDDLQDACNEALFELEGREGIQRRQLQKDIRFMESEQGWAIPLERIRFGSKNQKVFYRYSDLGFSINNQPLNDTETRQLKAALQVLSRFTGTPQFEWISEIIPVIESKLGLVGKQQSVIAFDSNLDVKGLEYFTPMFNAIVNKAVLNVMYKTFGSEEVFAFDFHPYYIKQYNNRWFVFGLNEQKNISTWNVPLDRIQSLSQTDYVYKTDDTDWESYFYDIIGVTRPFGEACEEVKLKFSQEQAPYVQTKPLHPSQRAKTLDDGTLEVRISVVLNFELERLLLSFGSRVEVLTPERLRDRIAGFHKDAAELYRNNP